MGMDVDVVVQTIIKTASDALEQDITQMRGFSERQVKALAMQAALVEAGIATGTITDETREFFLDNLKDMARNFVKTLHGLLAITIEKVWNAVVQLLWTLIAVGAGLASPVP